MSEPLYDQIGIGPAMSSRSGARSSTDAVRLPFVDRRSTRRSRS